MFYKTKLRKTKNLSVRWSVCVCVLVAQSCLTLWDSRCCVYVFLCLLRWHHRYACMSKLFKLRTLNMFRYLYVNYSPRNLETKRKAKSLHISKSNMNFLPCFPTHSNYTVFSLCFLFLQL